MADNRPASDEPSFHTSASHSDLLRHPVTRHTSHITPVTRHTRHTSPRHMRHGGRVRALRAVIVRLRPICHRGRAAAAAAAERTRADGADRGPQIKPSPGTAEGLLPLLLPPLLLLLLMWSVRRDIGQPSRPLLIEICAEREAPPGRDGTGLIPNRWEAEGLGVSSAAPTILTVSPKILIGAFCHIATIN